MRRNTWQTKIRAFGQEIVRDRAGIYWWELLFGILVHSIIFTVMIGGGLILRDNYHVSNEFLIYTSSIVFTVLTILVLYIKWIESTKSDNSIVELNELDT